MMSKKRKEYEIFLRKYLFHLSIIPFTDIVQKLAYASVYMYT